MNVQQDHNFSWYVHDRKLPLKEKGMEKEREGGRTKSYEVFRVGFLFTDQTPCDSSAIFLRSLQVRSKWFCLDHNPLQRTDPPGDLKSRTGGGNTSSVSEWVNVSNVHVCVICVCSTACVRTLNINSKTYERNFKKEKQLQAINVYTSYPYRLYSYSLKSSDIDNHTKI